tara:strand:+ start:10389 stop:11537 length:1149 start_codon:yes stop_codon:yes gene_type:complete
MPHDISKIKNKVVNHKKKKDFHFSLGHLLTKDINLFGSSIKQKDKRDFYQNLHIMLSSGLDLKAAFEIIKEIKNNNQLAQILQLLYDRLIIGDSLSEAMRKTGKFSEYEIISIKIGEESGLLNDVTQDLTNYFNDKIEQRKKILNALSYPILVFITSILVLSFMLAYVVPMFSDIFQRFNTQLPQITLFIISVSKFFTKNIYYIIIGIALLIILYFILRQNFQIKLFIQQASVKIPFFGPLLLQMHLLRFFHAMYLLNKTHTPLLQALDLTSKMMTFIPLNLAVENIKEEIFKGTPLHVAMQSYSDLFGNKNIVLVKISEQVNRLSFAFNEINRQLQNDINYKTSTLTSVMEPLLILSIGLFVAIVLIAMYLPLFELSTTVF